MNEFAERMLPVKDVCAIYEYAKITSYTKVRKKTLEYHYSVSCLNGSIRLCQPNLRIRKMMGHLLKEGKIVLIKKHPGQSTNEDGQDTHYVDQPS